HFCWAYRLSTDRNIFRINDDGEPSGTAGRPILNILLSSDLTQVFVVVVRYFGGTLLGVPGLINAYKNATLEAVSNSIIIEKTINDIYQIEFDYLAMNDVMRIVKESESIILEQKFDSVCTLTVEIRKSNLNQTLSRFKKIDSLTSNYLRTT
ncbi:MAG: YigZ family protein, partial [Sphingobacteriaceae bacterium]|nr:YigZ family protein [Sphingobacteriaceae bacterium]